MLTSFPGVDSAGFKDPTGIKIATFASTAARDTWVTAVGSANVPAGYMCFITGTNAVNVWNGSAWRSIATT